MFQHKETLPAVEWDTRYRLPAREIDGLANEELVHVYVPGSWITSYHAEPETEHAWRLDGMIARTYCKF